MDIPSFNPLLIKGYLDCFQSGRCYKTAISIHVQLFWREVVSFHFYLGKYPGGQLLGHMLIACAVFKETAQLISAVAVPCTFPPAVDE